MESKLEKPSNSFCLKLPLHADENKSEEFYDFKDELKKMAIKSFPLSLAIFFFTSNMFFELYFLNEYTDDADVIAGYSLSNALIMILTLALISALNNGMVARVSQAYGQGNIRLCGLLFHKSLIINLLITIPFLVPIFLIKQVLSLMGSNDSVCEYAHEYAYSKLPGALLSVVVTTIASLFTGVKIMVVPSVIQALTSIVGLILGYFLTLKADMGLIGLGLASSISWTLAFIFVILFIIFKNPLKGLFFLPCKESTKDLWAHFKFEINVGGMTLFDLATSQFTSMVSASFTSNEIYGIAVSGNLSLMFNTVGIAIGMVVSTYIGAAIGQANIPRLKGIIKTGVILALSSSAVLMVLGYSLSGPLVDFLTTEPEAFDYGLLMFKWALILTPINSIAGVANSTVRTIGKEMEGIIIVGVSDCLVFIPGCLIFGKVFDLRGIGFTISSLISYTLKTLGFAIVLKKVSWEQQIKIVQRAIKKMKDVDDEF